MQTIDPRAGLLCNHEVLTILRQQRDDRANQIKKLTQQKAKRVAALKRKAYPNEEEDEERDRLQPQDLHTVTFETIKFLQDPTHPHLRQTTSSVQQLLDKLEQLDLTKAERLQIVNLAPTKLIHFVLSVDEFEERFPGQEERDHLLAIVRDHLSAEPAIEPISRSNDHHPPSTTNNKVSSDARGTFLSSSRKHTTTHVVEEEYEDDMALDEATRDELDAANELMDEGMGEGGMEDVARPPTLSRLTFSRRKDPLDGGPSSSSSSSSSPSTTTNGAGGTLSSSAHHGSQTQPRPAWNTNTRASGTGTGGGLGGGAGHSAPPAVSIAGGLATSQFPPPSSTLQPTTRHEHRINSHHQHHHHHHHHSPNSPHHSSHRGPLYSRENDDDGSTTTTTTTTTSNNPNNPAAAQGHSNDRHHHSSSSQHHYDKVASASTAVDRVMAMLDGFEDDMDCPLCLEEMDLSDLNFKPCPCGYQICRFCYHHIKENLNNRCPACRTPYDDKTVEFKAVKPEELKRLQAAKKLRDKRRKDEELSVKNRANVRVRQRAQVHVQGMTTKIANEDTLAYLKGSEQFGQYGKVVKLFMSKRTTPVAPSQSSTAQHAHFQPVNVYVSYRTPAEASACIAAIDGTTTSDGHKLKAIWGTTRYCPTYLKGLKCNNDSCMQAHEPGEEIEGAGPASREEIYAYHAVSDSEQPRKKDSLGTIRTNTVDAKLPATASWASKNGAPIQPIIPNPSFSLQQTTSSTSTPLAAKPSTPSRQNSSAATTSLTPKPPTTHPLPSKPVLARPNSIDTTRKEAAVSSSPAAAVEAPFSILPTSSTPATTASISADATPQLVDPIASSSSTSAPILSPGTTQENGHAPNGMPTAQTVTPPRPRSPSPVPHVFPELEFGDGGFSFSFDLDTKGKGRAFSDGVFDDRGGALHQQQLQQQQQHLWQQQKRVASPFGFQSEWEAGVRRREPLAFDTTNMFTSIPSYMGSFDPFADTSNSFEVAPSSHSQHHHPHDELRSETPSPTPSFDDQSRRGSRFGFARRSSSNFGVKNGELASALARSAFAETGGRHSPASFTPPPPGIGMPMHSGGLAAQQPTRSLSSSSSLGFGFRSHLDGSQHRATIHNGELWHTSASSAFPPGVVRSLATATSSPSSLSSPQLSPRVRAGMIYGGNNGTGATSTPPGVGVGGMNIGSVTANAALPPGISLNRSSAIAAASFPLPPPAPRTAHQQQQQQQQMQQQQQQQQQQKAAFLAQLAAGGGGGGGGGNNDGHKSTPSFSDPAILNARLAANAPLPPPPNAPYGTNASTGKYLDNGGGLFGSAPGGGGGSTLFAPPGVTRAQAQPRRA
ncbi:hypothetical protein MVLG_03525 [Microbotryum lychnidis-dioicae p1A1 Lamole]|uniref:RING-type domain-containing protein n=1 Tax=Microbotryum lychnidis-dioicae (strain p1A1 Lamole / MvSl-1064) TaxID=683840 RepID=U5H8G6_USTV1|nr:hypothetical protein MVLG_03525 [Microbotryum lychnidis-dioicae p1A1 Lamole]|eukprot:KDE06108.1 hypothetical protein MVLG_03525 [Microbotryum lychnidis-dioicae p1A1 Lamole]